MSFCDLETVSFGEGGDEHEGGVDEEADGHALEEGDAAGVVGEPLHEGDEDAVVEDDAGEHGEGDEGVEAGRGNLEGPEVAVQGGALLHEQGVGLSHHGAGDDGDQQDWEHHYHLFCFFYFCYCA